MIEEAGGFPSASTVIRGFGDRPVAPAKIAVLLRILLVVSRPAAQRDVPPLPVTRSVASLRALGADVTLLLRADLASLEATLTQAEEQNRPFTVVQFDVHGATRADGQFGIVLDKQGGGQHWVPAADIAETLKDRGIRVIVANACRSGRSFTAHAGGTSFPATLLDAGIPAVIAMAYDLRADAAPVFTAAFYGALERGKSLTHAIGAARRALRAAPRRKTRTGFIDLVDWWIPVAYLHEEVVFARSVSGDGSTDEVARSAISDMRSIEDAAYQVLASLLRGKHVILGGLRLGGQSLAAREALDILSSVKPERRVVNVLSTKRHYQEGKFDDRFLKRMVDAAPDELLVIRIDVPDNLDLVQRMVGELGVLSGAQLLVVCECVPGPVAHFDTVNTANIDWDDVPHLLIKQSSDYDVFEDIIQDRTETALSRLFASPVLLQAYCQLARTKGWDVADKAIQTGLAGRRSRHELSTIVQATVALFDWTDTVTVLAGLMPLSVSESLFQQCAVKSDPERSVDGWLAIAERTGILVRRDKRCYFHPLFAPALSQRNDIDTSLRESVVAAIIFVVTKHYCEDLNAFDDLRAPAAIATATADASSIEKAIDLVIRSDFLGESRWCRFASPLLHVLSTVRCRNGEEALLEQFADRCWRFLEHHRSNPNDDETAFWMSFARDGGPHRIEVGGAQPNKWHYLLGIEIVVRQLITKREFTGAEAQVRRAIDVLGDEPALLTHPLYNLIAEIGEWRGWTVMAQGARRAAVTAFEVKDQPVPLAVEARHLLKDVQRTFFAYLAGGRAVDNVQDIDDLPARLHRAEFVFRTLRSSADLCELLILSTRIKIRLGQPLAAIAKGEEALSLAERRQDDWRRTSGLLALGDAYLAAFAIDSARLYYGEAIRIAMQVGDKRLEASSWAGLAETSHLLGRTAIDPIGFSAYQEMEKAYQTLAEYGATEAPQAAVRQSIDVMGPAMVGGTTTMTAFQELQVPAPETVRVTEITQRFVEADVKGETLWLVGAYIDILQAF